MDPDGLTAKQAVFCAEYLKDFNATKAAIRAGYSRVTACQAGYENLQRPKIKKRIRELVSRRNTKTLVAADKVVQELAAVAFDRQAIRISDKLRALDILAKHVGAFHRNRGDYPEFLSRHERIEGFIAAIPDDFRCFFSIATLLGPEEKQAVVEAAKQMEQKLMEQVVSSDGSVMIRYDPEYPSDGVDFLRKTLGKERIKKSVAAILDDIFSEERKRSVDPDIEAVLDRYLVERIATYELDKDQPVEPYCYVTLTRKEQPQQSGSFSKETAAPKRTAKRSQSK